MKLLFICHGNICRSPMAQFICRHLLDTRYPHAAVTVDSCATSTEEIWNGVGNPIYPPAAATLRRHGIPYDKGKRARRLTGADCVDSVLLLCMDANNVRNVCRMFPDVDRSKVRLLLDYCGGGEVSDPWYTGDFEQAYRDVERGCMALLDSLFGTQN